jgi:hypothetical protein
MKKLLFSIMITGAMSLTGIVQSANYTMITVEANNGQILEMPVYIESEIMETIPGSDDALFLCCQSDLRKEKFEGELIQADLSTILLCISKPETEEPLPFELN